MIDFQNVSKVYPEHEVVALRDVTFHMEPGQMRLLMGESGAGKTTLIKMILGEEKVSRGTITINGRDISKLGRFNLSAYRRTIGLVFQDFRLINNSTVYENVALPKRISGAKSKDIHIQVTHALRVVGLEDKYDRNVEELSGGEMQRVGIARAIVNHPDILLADEPTGNLDPTNSEEIFKLLKKVNEMGTTVLIATHDVNAPSWTGAEVLRMEKGYLFDK